MASVNFFSWNFMQLYGLEGDSPIFATEAQRHKSYRCPECFGSLRVRGGPHRQKHFYHLHPPKECLQHKKSLSHLQTQLLLYQKLPENERAIEKPFPEIGRIADVAWLKEKIIFEVQCSPISLDEVRQRCLDYESLGFACVWVLHSKRFNKRFIGAAEHFLRTRGCYFTTIDEKGRGIIYDQFDICQRMRRLFRGSPLLVDLTKKPTSLNDSLSFPGDLRDRLSKRPPHDPIFSWMKSMKEKYATSPKRSRFSLSGAYRALFHMFLEKLSR